VTPLELVAEFAKLAAGGVSGFTLSFLLWVYLPTEAILLLPTLGLVTAMGVALRRNRWAKAAGTGWLVGVVITVLGAALALHTAYYW
jgi:hypothetical protein